MKLNSLIRAHNLMLNGSICTKCGKLLTFSVQRFKSFPAVHFIGGFHTQILETKYAKEKKEKKEKKAETRKKRPNANKVYSFIDEAIAEQIANAILKNRKYKDGILVETDAGQGILTRALMENGKKIQKYIAVENNMDYLKALEDLQKKLVENTFLVKTGNLSHFKYTHKYGGLKGHINLPDIVPLENKKQKVTFVGKMSEGIESSMVFHMLEELAEKEGVFSNINPEYFFFVSPAMCRRLRCVEVRGSSLKYFLPFPMMMHQLFKIKYIDKVPLTSLNLLPVRKFQELKLPDDVVTGSNGYLFHMVPQLNVIREVDNFHHLYKFLFQIITKKKRERLIPKICNMFPDSGIHLVCMGILMIDRLVDITPQQYLQIYTEMKTWPGYEESIIHSMLSDSDIKDEKSHVEHGLIEHHEEHDLMEYHGEHKKLIKHQDQHTEIIKHEEN
ncbi:dimethyladenosine transferase 2, mitochondrial-like [Mytilus galloprovincialis]|uniref:dimethyladenosine transferase 2, mitochondrial-like n=1 Tax=Mytilus galloprovincialis TaxID=29158 RepID=UPI003F7B835F